MSSNYYMLCIWERECGVGGVMLTKVQEKLTKMESCRAKWQYYIFHCSYLLQR